MLHKNRCLGAVVVAQLVERSGLLDMAWIGIGLKQSVPSKNEAETFTQKEIKNLISLARLQPDPDRRPARFQRLRDCHSQGVGLARSAVNGNPRPPRERHNSAVVQQVVEEHW